MVCSRFSGYNLGILIAVRRISVESNFRIIVHFVSISASWKIESFRICFKAYSKYFAMVLKLYRGIPLSTFNAAKLYKKIMQIFHLQIEYERVNVENMVQISFFNHVTYICLDSYCWGKIFLKLKNYFFRWKVKTTHCSQEQIFTLGACRLHQHHTNTAIEDKGEIKQIVIQSIIISNNYGKSYVSIHLRRSSNQNSDLFWKGFVVGKDTQSTTHSPTPKKIQTKSRQLSWPGISS